MAYQSEIEKLEQRYRENPDQWFAALADSYRKAGSLDLALDVVRAGLEKRPNYVSGHIVLGRCLLQQPNDVAAQGAFEKVLALDAENVIALKALSEIAERAGQPDDARRWLTRLLEVDPMNDEAEQALGRLGAAPPTAPTAAAGEAGEAGSVEQAPDAGIEPTVGEMPAVGDGGTSAEAAAPAAPEEFVLEKSEEAAVPEAALDAFALEGPAPILAAPEAPAAAERPAPAEVSDAGQAVPAAAEQAASAPGAAASGLEPIEFEAAAGAGVPAAEGVENLAFEPPEPGETPMAPDLEPMEFTVPPEGAVEADAEGPVAPFDDQLAWGTGQRLSGQISQDDLSLAEQAHEASLEPVAEVAGLEGPSAPGDGDTGSGAGSGDLPLIFPDEPPAQVEDVGRDGEPPAATEAAPVLTETMAELYVKQGLVAEAREIYRTLLAQRPGDAALTSRLAALEATRGAGGGRVSKPKVTAAETGGPSVRDFLAQVFGGAPFPPPVVEAAAVSEAARPEPVLAEAPGASAGAPTRRASDEVSLAAVFGEEPVPAAPHAPSAEPAKGGGGSFSFDEFFGGQAKGPDGAPSTRAAAGRGEDDDDDFKRWLKGLKS